jgi:hypothetical protein
MNIWKEYADAKKMELRRRKIRKLFGLGDAAIIIHDLKILPTSSLGLDPDVS